MTCPTIRESTGFPPTVGVSQPASGPDGSADDADLLGEALVAGVLRVDRHDHHPRRLGVAHMLDPPGDQPHHVPDHEGARRDRGEATAPWFPLALSSSPPDPPPYGRRSRPLRRSPSARPIGRSSVPVKAPFEAELRRVSALRVCSADAPPRLRGRARRGREACHGGRTGTYRLGLARSRAKTELPPRNETESSFRIRTGRDMEREGTMAARKRLSPAQVINRLRKAEPGRPNQSLSC